MDNYRPDLYDRPFKVLSFRRQYNDYFYLKIPGLNESDKH